MYTHAQGDRFDEIIDASGRRAPKAILSSGDGSTTSKITAALVMAQDMDHARVLKEKAAAGNFLLFNMGELESCGDARAASFSTSVIRID